LYHRNSFGSNLSRFCSFAQFDLWEKIRASNGWKCL